MRRAIVGIDEAGRGPLAGPVAVGVVWISPRAKLSYIGLTDSKKLSEKKREEWFRKMKEWQKEGKIRCAVTLVSHGVIDTKGIVYAVKLGIKKGLQKIDADPKRVEVLLDGALSAPVEFTKQQTIIKGDEKIPAISLASIAAKVTRDKKMKSLSKKYPQYGFEIHKGYGTLAHRNALAQYGVSKIHRISFIKK